MLNTEERRISETVSEEQGGGGDVVTGGANAASSTGTAGGEGQEEGEALPAGPQGGEAWRGSAQRENRGWR